jgi:hypothetical protein
MYCERALCDAGKGLPTIRKFQFSSSIQSIIERDYYALCLLVNEHGMTLAEGPSPDILTGDPHVKALLHKRAERQGLCA